MVSIITTSQVQKNIGKISADIDKKIFIVTKRGEGSIVMLPYFDGCDERISDYMEDYEMLKNKDKLQERYIKSSESGPSALQI